MAWLKYLIIVPIFVILALLQNSFLPYLAILGTTPNLIFIFFFIVIFCESIHEYYEGVALTIFAGLLLGLFYPLHFNYSIVLLLCLYIIFKVVTHFIGRGTDKRLIVYFVLMFLACFLAYATAYRFFLFHAIGNVNIKLLVIEAAYNMGVAFLGFYGYVQLSYKFSKDRQLKLF